MMLPSNLDNLSRLCKEQKILGVEGVGESSQPADSRCALCKMPLTLSVASPYRPYTFPVTPSISAESFASGSCSLSEKWSAEAEPALQKESRELLLHHSYEHRYKKSPELF